MLLSFLGIKASGLKRSHFLFVIIKRFLKHSFKNLQKFFLALIFLISLSFLFFLSEKENSYLQLTHTWLGELATKILYYGQLPFQTAQYYCRTHDSLQKQVENLTLENQQLRRFENQAGIYYKENQILKKIAKVVEESTTETITVRVLARPTDIVNSLLVVEIKPGLNLQKDQVVMSTEGVIGRIYKVGLTCAWVLLITDSRSRIPARIISTGEDVILIGQNTTELKILHIATSLEGNHLSPKEGDILVTSGFGGIYPAGSPVAKVISFEKNVLKAAILGEFEEFVMIKKNIIPKEHDKIS